MFCVFCWSFKNNCPESGVLAQFFSPRGRDFALSLCPRGNSPFQKNSPGCTQGGWSDLELTDTYSPASSVSLLVCEFNPRRQTWYKKFIGNIRPLLIPNTANRSCTTKYFPFQEHHQRHKVCSINFEPPAESP